MINHVFRSSFLHVDDYLWPVGKLRHRVSLETAHTLLSRLVGVCSVWHWMAAVHQPTASVLYCPPSISSEAAFGLFPCSSWLFSQNVLERIQPLTLCTKWAQYFPVPERRQNHGRGAHTFLTTSYSACWRDLYWCLSEIANKFCVNCPHLRS